MSNRSGTPSYLEELNEVQRQAVTQTEGPVLVVAGPGSGKTRVLTYRISYLIDSGVPPWQILALTFTNKAAREMKQRISNRVGAQAEKVWAGTFHSIFARILRVEADKIGYPSDFTIYDTEDSKNLIKAILSEMRLDKNQYNLNVVRSRISSAKSNLITPKLYAQNEELLEQDRMAKLPRIVDIYRQYVARCKRSGAMDFDDLLYRLFELLQANPEDVARKYREKFQYLLVDEFQDTNFLQYAIVKKLVQYENSPRNICVVGDDAQSIYAFRGATIQNILDFEKDFQKYGIRIFKLEQNYRSTSHIVEAANSVITFNRRQIQKKIWSDKGEGRLIKLIKAQSDTEEGKRIADNILEQKNRDHLSNSDIAILYRTNAQSRIFEEYLRRYNIPYRIYGGQSFYQRKEVKDLIAYLRLAVNPRDDEALRRVINLPKRGIGKTTVDKLAAYAAEKELPLWDVLGKVPFSGKASQAIAGFAKLIQSFESRNTKLNAYEMALFIARKSGLLDSLKADTTIEGMGRLENMEALLDGIKAFVEEDTVVDTATLPDKSLATYLQNIALLTDADENENGSSDFVTLMSVHAAKGLEFKSVFIVGLEEKLFPSFMAMDSIEGLDEERRLFYVAITRAELFLTLSYAVSRYRYGKMNYNEASRFLDEVPIEHMEQSSRMGHLQTAASSGAKVMGNFKRREPSKPAFQIDPATFKPSPPGDIEAGMDVLHLKFGKGKVLKIEGGASSKMATIHFEGMEDNPERRIMLKFAKLQILDPA